MKILTVIGARPQFIKAAAFSKEIVDHYSGQVEEVILHTGQHYDENMSGVFFQELGIPQPKHNLNVGSASHAAQTALMLEGIERVMGSEKPDALCVYGDTNSTLAGGLAASKIGIPVIHIEAGLRSFNMAMPEEQNRIITDHISTYLFCPTRTAIENLERENIVDGMDRRFSHGLRLRVKNVGDIMADSVRINLPIAERVSSIQSRLQLVSRDFILCTIHRAENTDIKKNLEAILSALGDCGLPCLLPLHPRTRKKVLDFGLSFPGNVTVIEPVSYHDMLALMSNCLAIMTDSGGVQKEAYFVKTPCITLRTETEWVETLNNGWNCIVPSDSAAIMKELHRITSMDFSNISQEPYFGDGFASRRIVNHLLGNVQ